MPLDLNKVKSLVADGLSPVCATCSRYWEGRERGLAAPLCTAARPCGGPVAGMDFPEYDGPITNFEKQCFVCGSTATLGIKLPTRERVVGICKPHVGVLDRLIAQGISEQAPITLFSPKGMIIPVNGRYTEKTLTEVIAETEQMFEETDKANAR